MLKILERFDLEQTILFMDGHYIKIRSLRYKCLCFRIIVNFSSKFRIRFVNNDFLFVNTYFKIQSSNKIGTFESLNGYY